MFENSLRPIHRRVMNVPSLVYEVTVMKPMPLDSRAQTKAQSRLRLGIPFLLPDAVGWGISLTILAAL